MRPLIIGYGNPLRRDDAFGWLAAQRLREAIPDAEVVTVHQLTPELMEPIARASFVVFLDASATGEPGTLTTAPVSPAGASTAFTHHATPAALIAGALALYGARPEAVLVTCAGADFDLGEGLSLPVERALEQFVRSAPQWVKEHMLR